MEIKITKEFLDTLEKELVQWVVTLKDNIFVYTFVTYTNSYDVFSNLDMTGLMNEPFSCSVSFLHKHLKDGRNDVLIRVCENFFRETMQSILKQFFKKQNSPKNTLVIKNLKLESEIIADKVYLTFRWIQGIR